jgi:hypothetical protein
MKYDFGFGDSFAVRAALQAYNTLHTISPFDCLTYSYFGYPPIETEEQLRLKISNIIETLTGRKYPYILLTHGATGGINSILRYMKTQFEYGEHDARYFIYYPEMFKQQGIIKSEEGVKTFQLTSAPSNPEGAFFNRNFSALNTVWDAVYYNPIYYYPSLLLHKYIPNHRVMVGSFGKLLGLNGLRLGWIATEDKFLYDYVVHDHVTENLGLSTASINILKNILFKEGFNLLDFCILANSYLEDNRTELAKLEKFFHSPVNPNGMFWFTEADSKAQILLKNSEVKTIPGSLVGADDNFIRISLGQDRTLTRLMVKEVLKKDKI